EYPQDDPSVIRKNRPHEEPRIPVFGSHLEALLTDRLRGLLRSPKPFQFLPVKHPYLPILVHGLMRLPRAVLALEYIRPFAGQLLDFLEFLTEEMRLRQTCLPLGLPLARNL